MTSFYRLERQVLERIAAQYPGIGDKLLEQFAASVITSRKYTGVGFFMDFSVDRSSAPAVSSDRVLGDVSAEIKGLQHGMGFILFMEDGYACTLEGFSFDDDTSGISFEHVEFSFRT